LKHLADENQFAVFVAVVDAVADHAFSERSGELGSEITDLISVRHEDEVGLRGFDYLVQGERKSVGRVFIQEIVFDEKYFVELKSGYFVSQRRDAFAEDYGGERAFGLLHDLLRGGESLEADFVPLAFALFGDQKYFHGL
jgi:hypothetical protein